jgi:3'-phosphoadenosine 5'-phosphosulfate sulfotransferase (PAPS reductase)/FAD synthetase
MSQNSLQFGPTVALAKPRLLLSFSFGKTSARMTELCLQHLADQYEMKVVIANTGQELEESLLFGHRCDQHFGFDATWVEAAIDPEPGAGTRHRVVTYETATRQAEEGGPFEAMIQKYGIPGPGRAHCTRELKANAIRSYLLSIGWDDYTIAIGIRPDEPRRVDEEEMRRANLGMRVKFIYPMVDFWYHDKQDVNDWHDGLPFQLGLEEWGGNCGNCWKKSDPKLFLMARKRPEVFQFTDTMEVRYPRVGAEFVKDPTAPDRVFFRKRRNTKQLLAEAASVADQPIEVLRKFAQQDPDANAGCAEACHPYPMLDFEAEPA